MASRPLNLRRVGVFGTTVGAIASLGGALACSSMPQATSPASSIATDTSVMHPPSGSALRPVTLPDFSAMGASVQKQMRAQVQSLQTKIDARGTLAAELGAEYGRLGTLLMAAEQIEAAEPCYLNAQTLAPRDSRWPYYLGQLYRIKGPVASAAASFERALELRPADVPTLIALGEVHLSQGRSDEAEPLFSKALALQPKLVPALFGIGRVALARKDYAAAVRVLEECLTLDPRATATHYPLGMAYRGLGDVKRAQAHLEQRGDVTIRPVDPLMDELDGILESPRAYDLRGGRLLETGDWANAATQFRKGLELDPSNPALRLRLGTALVQLGDFQGAREQFERVLQVSPTYAKAHHSLGILAEAGGRHAEALERLAAAVKYDPNDASSRVLFANLLRQQGRMPEALEQYDRARTLDPTRADATVGSARALASLGRYREARQRLVEATAAFPNDADLAGTLARLLAAAPDARVRDGHRALAIVQELLKGRQTIDLGETLAMALAEIGQFDQAVRVQRDVIQATERAGLPDAGGAMAANLALYQRRTPCRTPWTDH